MQCHGYACLISTTFTRLKRVRSWHRALELNIGIRVSFFKKKIIITLKKRKRWAIALKIPLLPPMATAEWDGRIWSPLSDILFLKECFFPGKNYSFLATISNLHTCPLPIGHLSFLLKNCCAPLPRRINVPNFHPKLWYSILIGPYSIYIIIFYNKIKKRLK